MVFAGFFVTHFGDHQMFRVTTDFAHDKYLDRDNLFSFKSCPVMSFFNMTSNSSAFSCHILLSDAKWLILVANLSVWLIILPL